MLQQHCAASTCIGWPLPTAGPAVPVATPSCSPAHVCCSHKSCGQSRSFHRPPRRDIDICRVVERDKQPRHGNPKRQVLLHAKQFPGKQTAAGMPGGCTVHDRCRSTQHSCWVHKSPTLLGPA